MSIDGGKQIGVIGAGIMGEALIAGLISSGVKPTSISFAEKRPERCAELISRYSITSAELNEVVATSDLLLLVVKPQDMQLLLEEIAPVLRPTTLLVSFAAGKTISFISSHTGGKNPVVRVMPNTPTLVNEGMAAFSAGEGVNDSDRAFLRDFLSSVGKVIEVPESLQDAVTATSGSGPAYFFAFVEAMVAGSTALGLSHEDATTLTVQTIVGAAKLLDESGKSATTLRENVTSPNGTTAAALASFTDSGLNEMVAKAMKAAAKRSQELA